MIGIMCLFVSQVFGGESISAPAGMSTDPTYITFTITASAHGPGSITPSGAVTIPKGQDFDFTIAPDPPNNSIDSVVVDGVNKGAVETYEFSNVQSNHTIAAYFSVTYYTITASAGPNGSIAPSGSVHVLFGGYPSFTITPDPGYIILGVFVDGTLQGRMASYTFPAVFSDHSINATFAPDTFAVTIATDLAGLSVIVDGNTVTSPASRSWTYRSNHTLSVVDTVPNGVNSRFVWSSWSNGGSKSQTVSPIANTTYTANFTTQYLLTMIGGPGGTVTPATDFFNSGQVVQIQAIPSPYYHFQTWAGSGSGSVSSSMNPADVTMGSPIFDTAYFSIDTAVITALSGPNGTISPSGSLELPLGSSQTYTMTPDGDYHISDVVVDGVSVGAVASFTFSDVSTSHTIIASFALHGYTITALAGMNGTISPSGPAAVDSGANQGFLITPDPGYHIDSLIVDNSSVTVRNPYTFDTVRSNHVIRVVFAVTVTVTVTVGTNPHGADVWIDGTDYGPSDQTVTWSPGSMHTICADSIHLAGTDPTLIFRNWNNGAGTACQVVAPMVDTTYSANYYPYYYLSVSSTPINNLSCSVLPQSGYYLADTCLLLDATGCTGGNVQWFFDGWTGQGPDSYTGPDEIASICMYENISEVAAYTSCNIVLAPTDTIFAIAGGRGTIRVSDDSRCSWQYSRFSAPWVHFDSSDSTGSGSAVLSYSVDPNNDTVLRTASATFWNGSQSVDFAVSQLGKLSCPPPWSFTNTGMNHTIIIDTSVHPSVGGVPLDPGDYIGVFFHDSSGALSCGGYELWTGTSAISVPAFGNELALPSKNGFAPGEVFKWQIFRCQAGQFYNATATYRLPDSVNHLTSTNLYVTNGISSLASLIGGVQSQSLSVRKGWSIISSYLNPLSAILDTLFSSIEPDLIILKNGAGKTYIPSIPVNSIGLWNSNEGYQIKTDSLRSLTINGYSIVPEITPVNILNGWSIIPYLRQSEMRVDSALAGIAPRIIIVKDQDGRAFIPSIPVNGIGTMKPGQGYQIKMTDVDTLYYPLNSVLLGKKTTVSQPVANIRVNLHYQLQHTSDNNATIAFPMKTVSRLLKIGDEVGIFNPKGMLVGAGMYEGESFAVAAWGDDPTTPEVDGMKPGELYDIRFWDRASSSESHVRILKWSEGTSRYEVNGLSIAEKVEATMLPKSDRVTLYQNYPNPFNPTTTVGFSIPRTMNVHIRIYNVLGELVTELTNRQFESGYHEILFNSTRYSSGIYYCRIDAGGSSDVKKMVLMK